MVPLNRVKDSMASSVTSGVLIPSQNTDAWGSSVRVARRTCHAPIGYQMMRGAPTWTSVFVGAQSQVLHSLTLTTGAERRSHRIGIRHRHRLIAYVRGVIMRHDVKVPYNVFTFDLDVHRPSFEVDLPTDLAVNDPLFRRTSCLVAHALLEVRLIL